MVNNGLSDNYENMDIAYLFRVQYALEMNELKNISIS
jgi:hypothetical protein